MEKNKFETNKTPCICEEESDETLIADSGTATVPDFKAASGFLKKHLEENTTKCVCTYDGQVKIPNRVSWVDEEDDLPECVCENAIPPEEPKKKKKTFGQTLKYLVTCACCKKSEESTPEPEPKPGPELEEIDTKDSGIISLLGRTYSEVSYGKDGWAEESIILVYDVEEDMPAEAEIKNVPQSTPAKAKIKDVPKNTSAKTKTKDVPKDTASKATIKDVPKDMPAKTKTKDVPQSTPTKATIKDVPKDMPAKTKTKDVPQRTPAKTTIKDVPKDAPSKATIKDVPKGMPAKTKTKSVPQFTPSKAKTKDVTPKVSFGKTLLKKKESGICICIEDTVPKYYTKSSSKVSTKSSQVKCKCTDPEETRSGHLIATKCVCGQLTPSEASLASGYTIGSRRSKPDCCYPEKSEELIRTLDYQRPSQYSYRQYDQPLRTYGREAPRSRSLYTPSAISSADSNQYMLDEDDISENLQLNDTGSTYTYRQSTSAIPSYCVSEIAAGPSNPPTLYERLVKRFWLESILYREPYQQPSRAQSAPSYISGTSLRRPASKYKTESKVKKPTAKSKEKVCMCSKIQLVAAPSKESKQKANVEKPKAEISDICICLKKSSVSVSKESKEELSRSKAEECHCLEILYMSKSPSKTERKPLSKTPSKTEEKVLSKTPSDVGTSTDQSKRRESKNVPTVIVTPAEETEAKLADKNGSKSSSNSSVVTVIDMHALQVPSVFATKPVDVKKSTEIQEPKASGSPAENPEETPPPLGNESSGWWNKSKHLIIGSTVVGATAIGAYQYFKE